MAATRTTQRRRGATRRRTKKVEVEVPEVPPRTTNLRVVHFEINADDVDRAVSFYRDVFGWDIQKWDSPEDPSMVYFMIRTGEPTDPGINGAIMPRIDFHASVINTVEVPTIDEFIDKVTSAGGKLVREKTEIPHVGLFAYVMDTEGNLLGIL